MGIFEVKLIFLLMLLVEVSASGIVRNGDGSVTFPERTIYATDNEIRIESKLHLSTESCALMEGVEAWIFNGNIRGVRLVKLLIVNGSGESTVSEDIPVELQNISISLECSINKTALQCEVALILINVTHGTSSLYHPPFKKIVLVLICYDINGTEHRNDVLYNIVYLLTAGKSTTVTDEPSTQVLSSGNTVSVEEVQSTDDSSSIGVMDKEKASQPRWYIPILVVTITVTALAWCFILWISLRQEFPHFRLFGV